MKIKTTDRFYAPVFNQIAELLSDYDIKTDHTDETLGFELTVAHKKYKHHGLNISTYVGSNPEWTIRAYVDLPLKFVGLPFYSFTPEKDSEGYPLLTTEQIDSITKKIKAIDKGTLNDIKSMKGDLEADMMQMDTELVNSFFNLGFDSLENFKSYGIKVDYEKFLLNPSKKSITNFRILMGIYISKSTAIKKLLEEAIEMYIDTMTTMTKDDAYQAATRFMTTDKKNSILGQFTDKNRTSYVEMVKRHFEDLTSDNNPEETYRDIIGFLRAIDSDYIIEMEILVWAYEKTEDEHFLSDEAKAIFLF